MPPSNNQSVPNNAPADMSSSEMMEAKRSHQPSDTLVSFRVVESHRGNNISSCQLSWRNKLFAGDNLSALEFLQQGSIRDEIEAAGGIRLIYIDPPFDAGRNFFCSIEPGSMPKSNDGLPVVEEVAYRDRWGDGEDSYLVMMAKRLRLMAQLLADDGCIYVHCDWRVSAYLRVLLDEIFGRENYANEIIWHYQSGGRRRRGYSRKHDTIHFYHKSDNWYFNPDTVSQIHGRDRRNHMKRNVDDDGRVFYTIRSAGKIYTYYEDEKRTPCDVWTDLSHIQQKDPERVGYDTQKPEALIERILCASSRKGDLVADFFCGSGTTLAVAERLGRRWIGCEQSRMGIHVARRRILDAQKTTVAPGGSVGGFDLMGPIAIGDAPFFNQKTKRSKSGSFCSRRYRQRILSAYGGDHDESILPFCGRIDERPIYVASPEQPLSVNALQSCLDACNGHGIAEADILALNYAPGTVRHAFDAKRNLGINIVPRLIPSELLNRSGMKIRRIRFPEAACVHVVSNVKDQSAFLRLVNYEVRGHLGGAKRVTECLPKNRNAFVVEDRNLVRVSRDRKGNITKAILTEDWIDWVDYWAVDFGDRKNPGHQSANVSTDNAVFVNDWESYRMRTHRTLERDSCTHTYTQPGQYNVTVKVIDIFGYETLEYLTVNVC